MARCKVVLQNFKSVRLPLLGFCKGGLRCRAEVVFYKPLLAQIAGHHEVPRTFDNPSVHLTD